MKATEQYFPVVLFIVLYKVVLTFESVDEILWCDHSNESSLPILSHDAICLSKFHKMKFGNLVEICLWPHLAVKGLFNNLYYTEAMAREALYFDFRLLSALVTHLSQLFEKGRKMCTRQSRKVLWVVWVFCSSKKFERMARRPRTYVCERLRKATKVGSTATVVRNSVLIVSLITFRECRVHTFFFRQPFSKWLYKR